MQRIHLIEKVGTGISRIREAVKENGRSEVEFNYDDFFTVTFKRSIEPDGTLNGTLSGTLKPGLKEVYECILARPGINAKNLSEDLKRPLDTVKKQIKRLVDQQMIERVGSKKIGGYQVKG